jgi:hypothetical protein
MEYAKAVERTDNTMGKRKRTKRQTMIYKTENLIEQQEPHYNPGKRTSS